MGSQTKRRLLTNWAAAQFILTYRRFFYAIGYLIILFFVGWAGFYYLEDRTLLQAYYGFIANVAGDWFIDVPRMQTHAGVAFTSLLSLAALIVAGYFISVLTSFIVEGKLKEFLDVTKMDKKISQLADHFIVCGADDTTREILEELTKLKVPLVVVYDSAERIKKMGQEVLQLAADPTLDQTLLTAGIEHAKGLIASLDSDQDNLFLTLSAKSLNPKLKVIAKVFDDDASQEKLKRAGADEVVSPFAIGGMRIASILVRPTVVGYLDTMLKKGIVRFEEIPVGKLAGKTIAESDFFKLTGLNITSLKKVGAEDYIYNPAPTEQLVEGDIIIVIGDEKQVEKARKAVA
jgi:voltage-gated potassium channel